MNRFTIALRSLQQRSLASLLTGLSMALGVALVVTVLVIHSVVSRSFNKGAEGFDLIVGAKGGKLQLVLNTIYHLSTPIENVPWSYYREFRPGGRFGNQVYAAIPLCLGDNYRGYRVVGTLPELFTHEYAQGESYRFESGRNIHPSHFFEAVIGYVAARNTGLKVGDRFHPTHGLTEGEGDEHDAFEVVGVLAPTGTPNDRAVFVNMEGFFLLDGHAKPLDPAQADVPPTPLEPPADAPPGQPRPLPESQREVTAILVRTANPLVNISLPRLINKEPFAQAVMPIREIRNLFDGLVGNFEKLLLLLATLVVFVSGIGVLVSIYNSMNDRRREIAILRALGASRGAVLSIILLESILLSIGGGIAGVILGHGLIAALNPIIVSQTGVTIGLLQFDKYEAVLLPALVVLATLVGFLPALTAYRTDVAKALTSAP